jgi:hypothetical protein
VREAPGRGEARGFLVAPVHARSPRRAP